MTDADKKPQQDAVAKPAPVGALVPLNTEPSDNPSHHSTNRPADAGFVSGTPEERVAAENRQGRP